MLSAVMNDVVRGPEKTERFERALVINPTCASTRPNSFPTQAIVVTTAARRMIELSKGGEKLDAIVVQGDVDPTLHPDFREIAENLRELSNKWFGKAQLTLVSDSLGLGDPEVRQSLSLFDQPILRLESGTQKTFAALTGRKPAEFKSVTENLVKVELERIVIEARFVRGSADNSTENEVKAWLRYLEAAKPAAVQLTTLEKADTARKLKPITRTRLEAIANQVADRTGLPVEIIQAA
jgi:wyosine [tRNA(Phe)-imidazoG37] synthetase (radical SAM superfamily)